MSSSRPLESTGRTAATDQERAQVFCLFLLMFILFLCSPLSIQTVSFSPAFYCAVCPNRHPCSQHVFGPLLSWPPDLQPSQSSLPDLQTHWPLWALREISSGKQLKNTNPATVHLPENHCPALRKTREKQQRRGQRGLVHKQHNNCSCWTNRKVETGTHDLTVSVSFAAREWPRRLAQAHKHSYTKASWA